jgi:AcrR family transcriptional regulator
MAAPSEPAETTGATPAETAGARGPRKSAEERREEILAVAMEHFGQGGYHGTSTEAIARDAGISQPYLFRLFRTKKELFLAGGDRACAKVIDAFRRAAANAEPGAKLEAMGKAYVHELLPDRHALFMLMQGYVAASDPEIRDHVRRKYGEVIRVVSELSGAPDDEVWRFFATGMHLNIVTAMDLSALASENPVAAAWVEMFET